MATISDESIVRLRLTSHLFTSMPAAIRCGRHLERDQRVARTIDPDHDEPERSGLKTCRRAAAWMHKNCA
jgi:hypothetical protein